MRSHTHDSGEGVVEAERSPITDSPLDPFYYLRNFEGALGWLRQMYSDLLSAEERRFIDQFEALPVKPRALLVRLIMRKHEMFRASRISYPEIGDIRFAAQPLSDIGFIDNEPTLTLAELFALLRREEINELFSVVGSARCLTKTELLAALQPQHLHARTLESWRGAKDECAYRVLVAELCARLRLLFFGSFRQDWSEFVLADLGILKFERVIHEARSRGFQSRADVDAFYRIYDCRLALHGDSSLAAVLANVPADPIATPWLEARRSKLLFEIAHRSERQGDIPKALEIYCQSSYPGARLRRIRLLERAGLYEEALQAVRDAVQAPESAAELQGLERVLPRLYRAVGIEVRARERAKLETLALSLDPLECSVEENVRQHLSLTAAPVFYVENALINSLFGLLFWDVIFAPVPGAFFHQFHSAPMDLYEPEFVQRRQRLVDACFAKLDSGRYVDCIRNRLIEKAGTSSPFVAWGLSDEGLLELAMLCIPPAHLRLFFQRILDDIRENCTGLPDLIQFWPEEQRYRLIEVKGPGDRLQDHQRRWAEFCASNELPMCVAYVSWSEAHA